MKVWQHCLLTYHPVRLSSRNANPVCEKKKSLCAHWDMNKTDYRWEEEKEALDHPHGRLSIIEIDNEKDQPKTHLSYESFYSLAHRIHSS